MIIESLLDTDLYKFTMMQCVLHQFPGASVEYRFRCRNEGVDLRPYRQEIEAEIDHLCTLRFKEDELEYLRSLRFIKDDFVEFLSLFQLKRKYIDISEKDGQLAITIKGPWLHTILFEIPVLAIVNETYFRHIAPNIDKSEGRFITSWNTTTKVFQLRMFFKTDEQSEAEKKRREASHTAPSLRIEYYGRLYVCLIKNRI